MLWSSGRSESVRRTREDPVVPGSTWENVGVYRVRGVRGVRGVGGVCGVHGVLGSAREYAGRIGRTWESTEYTGVQGRTRENVEYMEYGGVRGSA